MSLIDKIKKKIRTAHKMRDLKKVFKKAIDVVEDSDIIDELKDAADDVEAMILASGLDTLADLIRDGKTAIPELKREIEGILDDVQ